MKFIVVVWYLEAMAIPVEFGGVVLEEGKGGKRWLVAWYCSWLNRDRICAAFRRFSNSFFVLFLLEKVKHNSLLCRHCSIAEFCGHCHNSRPLRRKLYCSTDYGKLTPTRLSVIQLVCLLVSKTSIYIAHCRVQVHLQCAGHTSAGWEAVLSLTA